jgi:hypothetical protein
MLLFWTNFASFILNFFSARLDMDYEFPNTKKVAEEIVKISPEPEVQEIAVDPTDFMK